MPYCKNHTRLYFDKLIRTKKQEAVLSLIHATNQAKINNGSKEDIANNLVSAYQLFKFDSGSYTGTNNQFESQYTIGHELGIWKNSNLDLTDLAQSVANNDITIKDYFDIFFLNYIQPIDNVVYNLMILIIEKMITDDLQVITKNDLKSIFAFSSDSINNEINGLFNLLIGTSYFKDEDINTLKCMYNPKDILDCCNREYHLKNNDEVSGKMKDMNFYLDYLLTDHRSEKIIQNKLYSKAINNKINSKIGENVIYYGIPGSGKSYFIENVVLENEDKKNNVFRTTFYLDYANSDFVGQILPYVEGEKVSYKYTPGPFTKALERALTTDNHVYLVIEELNRGNAAAIFGDIFQLLDRKKGVSEYPISNSFIENYFRQENDNGKNIPFEEGNIVIPNNMSILATMNTSDQNVFPLDTAFKRRWSTKRVVPEWSKCDFKDETIPCTDITWFEFASKVNAKMDTQSFNGVTQEDKQLGPWFVDASMFINEKLGDQYTKESKESLAKFVDKVIDYMYHDVAKFNPEEWFEGVHSFNSLCEEIKNYADSNYKKDKNFMFKEITFETKGKDDEQQ